MNIGTISPIYAANDKGFMSVQFSAAESVINFTGFTLNESKYKMFETALRTSRADLIITDSDVISYEHMVAKLKVASKNMKILVFFNDVASACPNLKRIQKAVTCLRKNGIKVQYCKNVESANKWLEKNGYNTLSLESFALPKDTKLIQWKDSHLSIVA